MGGKGTKGIFCLFVCLPPKGLLALKHLSYQSLVFLALLVKILSKEEKLNCFIFPEENICSNKEA